MKQGVRANEESVSTKGPKSPFVKLYKQRVPEGPRTCMSFKSVQYSSFWPYLADPALKA